MNPIIEAKKPEIIALCRHYGVIKLDLFGSATGPNWDTEFNDIPIVGQDIRSILGNSGVS